MDRLDLCTIGKLPAITDMKAVFCHVHVLDPKGECLDVS
jgi:hypothetical protein